MDTQEYLSRNLVTGEILAINARKYPGRKNPSKIFQDIIAQL